MPKITLYPPPEKQMLEILSLLRPVWPDLRFTADGIVGGTPPEPAAAPKTKTHENIIFLRPQAS